MCNGDTSDVIKFSKFLNFIISKKFYDDCEYKTFDSITNVSKSDNSKIVFYSTYSIINFDKLCENAYTSKSGKKSDKPATSDGLFFRYNKNKFDLYFIEFKGHYLSSPDYYDILRNQINYMKNFSCVYKNLVEDCPFNRNMISLLENVHDTYVNEIFHKSLLKPYESLFIVFPKIYKKYCDFNNLSKDNRILNFNNFLKENVNLYYIVVGFENNNIINSHFNLRNKLNAKYKPLRNNIYKGCHIYNTVEFQKFFKEVIVENPLSNKDKLITSIVHKISNLLDKNFVVRGNELSLLIKYSLNNFLNNEFANCKFNEYECNIICNEAFNILSKF